MQNEIDDLQSSSKNPIKMAGKLWKFEKSNPTVEKNRIKSWNDVAKCRWIGESAGNGLTIEAINWNLKGPDTPTHRHTEHTDKKKW